MESAMSRSTFEHVNLTVTDLPRVLHFVQTALPDWRVRGGGTMDWFGQPIDWCHVGTDEAYIALQSGGNTEALDWQSLATGVKHIGLVVPDMDAVVQRLTAAGFPLDHLGDLTAVRRSAYVVAPGSVQFEFVQYNSTDPALRNDYSTI
jgi:catechol 2,3-dioxygenase-like lactoylglutathione lyase family enzyme